MPTIRVKKTHFFELLGKSLTDEEIDDISFSYGLESEKDEDPEWYRIELPANRYDLLSAEGLSMALAQYLDIKSYPKFAIANPPQLLKMTVSKSTEQIRPVCVCAVLRNLTFTQENYDSFIDFQDKLHHNLGRRRTIVSIGTHDLDTIEGPFTYEALAPQEINFVPLNKTESVDGNELMKMYEDDMQLKAFLHIVRDSPVYPVIKDGKGRVCSLPPIINGDHSKITFNTKNVFIECTATDWTKARMAVNLLCQAFSIYSSSKGSIEQVEVTLPSGETIITPDIGERSVACNLEFMNTAGGISVTREEAIECLKKMGLSLTPGSDLTFQVPMYRTDILHECDVAEDLAISYGYDNVVPIMPPVNCIGTPYILNKVCDIVREEICHAGYNECLNFALCSIDDLKCFFRVSELTDAVVISNPKTKDFQVGRTTLLPGMLKTLYSNKKNKLPIQLFEVSDVVLLDPTDETGAKNQRRVAVLYTDTKHSCLDLVHGTLDFLMGKLRICQNKETGYSLELGNKPFYFKQLQANVMFKGKEIGHMGVLHPDVLAHKDWEWTYPVSIFEINIEALMEEFLRV